MKTINGSGTSIICKDKYRLEKEKTINELRKWLKRDYYAAGREWACKGINPKIIVEEFLVENTAPNMDINDYRILSFNGEPKYIIIDIDRYFNHKRNIYTIDCDRIDVNT